MCTGCGRVVSDITVVFETLLNQYSWKMSIVFVPKKLRGTAKINQETIQRLLDENDQLIRCITEYMQKGRAMECVQYQQILHRNIVYLGTIADASPDNTS
ncbi:unnamed protein product, partial [Tetraodon nigroviridis]